MESCRTNWHIPETVELGRLPHWSRATHDSVVLPADPTIAAGEAEQPAHQPRPRGGLWTWWLLPAVAVRCSASFDVLAPQGLAPSPLIAVARGPRRHGPSNSWRNRLHRSDFPPGSPRKTQFNEQDESPIAGGSRSPKVSQRAL